jgi:hypothetical protein
MPSKRRAKPIPRARPHRPDPQREVSPDEADVVLRLLASAMGLPRLCVFKACRRRRRCLGPGLACSRHHHGLVERRIDAAIRLISAR